MFVYDDGEIIARVIYILPENILWAHKGFSGERYFAKIIPISEVEYHLLSSF